MITYGTFCSGIGAPECAWTPLGWRSLFCAEIEPFPCAALAHHYPHTPNLGDMEKISGETLSRFNPDVVCAGTPCQSFSVAGLRKGMADPRGNLALVFLGLVDRLRPRWLVWENVPGVLSSGDGRDFGSFLGALGQLGYGWAYRIMDAQYCGVPQRRRRVFVVGCLGDWRGAAAVLLERHGLQGHPAPSREAGARTSEGVACGTDSSGSVAGTLPADYGKQGGNGMGEMAGGLIAHSLRAEGFDASEDGTGRGTPLVPVPILEAGKRCGVRNDGRDGIGIGQPGDPMFTLQAGAQHAVAHPTHFSARVSRNSHTSNQVGIKDDGLSDALSTDGPGAIAIPFDTTQITSAANYSNPKPGDPCHPLAEGMHAPAVAFQTRIARNGRGKPEEICPTLQGAGAGATSDMRPCVNAGMAVRRLTPLECERLQGFPDFYSAIPFKGKAVADGPRYRALGNSMAVPVMRWIGERIAAVDAIRKAGAA